MSAVDHFRPSTTTAMMPAEAFALLAATLKGEPISHVWRGYGSAIFIEVGNLRPRSRRDGEPGNPVGEVTIGVQWSWRTEDQSSIRCGSESDDDRWEPALSLLRGARISECKLFGALPELMITTEAGVRFISFSTTDGQPQWHVVDRRDPSVCWFTVRDGRLHLGDGTEPSS